MYNQKAVLFALGMQSNNFGLSYTLNDAAKKFDIAFQVPQAFTVAKVAWKNAARTGTPTYTIRLETDSAGRPSGTLVATGTEATGQTVPAAGVWTGEVSLGAAAALSVGTAYHLVISNDHGTPASNTFAPTDTNSIPYAAASGYIAGFDNPVWFTSSYSGSAWTNRYAPLFVLSDSGGTYKFGQSIDASTTQTLSSSTAYGVKFTARVSGTCIGVVYPSLPNTSTATVTGKLYTSGDTLLGTATKAAGWANIFGRNNSVLYFDGEVTLTAGSTYRVVFNDSGSADRLEFVTCPSSPTDYRQLMPVFQDAQWTQGTTGSWTDTTGKLPAIFGLVMSDVTTPVCGPSARNLLVGGGVY